MQFRLVVTYSAGSKVQQIAYNVNDLRALNIRMDSEKTRANVRSMSAYILIEEWHKNDPKPGDG